MRIVAALDHRLLLLSLEPATRWMLGRLRRRSASQLTVQKRPLCSQCDTRDLLTLPLKGLPLFV